MHRNTLFFAGVSHSAAGSCLTLIEIQNLEVPLPTSLEGMDLVGNFRACITHTGRISLSLHINRVICCRVTSYLRGLRTSVAHFLGWDEDDLQCKVLGWIYCVMMQLQ